MSAALQQAVQLLQAGRAAEAEAVLDRMLTQSPDDAEALQLRGMARGRLGRFEAGAADLERAAKRHAQPHAVLSNLGNLRRRAGDAEAALSAYRQALELKPDFVDARFNLGLCLSELTRLDEAAAAFEAVLALRPDHPGALNGLGVVRAKAGDEAGALEAYGRAIAVNTAAINPRLNRGAIFRRLHRLKESLADLDAACRLAPQSAEAHYQRGHTLRTLGRLAHAHDAYWQAVRLAPMRPDIHRDLASLLWEMGRGEEATAALDHVLASTPDAELHHTRGMVLIRTGRTQAALDAFIDTLALDPRHASARAMKGEVLARQGETEAGIGELSEALALTGGESFAIRHQLAETCLSAGRVDAALEALEPSPPPEHLQKHVALQATAWRCAGDERYRRLYDYDLLTAKRFIEPPAGFDSLDAFNAALAESIARLHSSQAQPVEQTLFGGTQSPGRLWNTDDPVIRALSQALLEAAQRFVGQLPDDEEHPFLARKTGRLELAGAWSVRLRSGGGHVDHIHPAGWISASYYVQVPESVMTGERAGWLRLGAPGLPGLDLPAERYIKPEPGAVIFFPSYMWHGVERFESEEMRVTAPFDLLPV